MMPGGIDKNQKEVYTVGITISYTNPNYPTRKCHHGGGKQTLSLNYHSFYLFISHL
jgi:hypothetical protein